MDRRVEAALDALDPAGRKLQWLDHRDRWFDAMTAALAAADAAAWQPIETLPDHGDFLVYLPTARRSKVQACSVRKTANDRPLIVIGGLFSFDTDKATHWRSDLDPPPPEPGS